MHLVKLMFNINFISDPGRQKELSDVSWSYLFDTHYSENNYNKSIQDSKVISIQKNNWRDYILIFTILCLIMLISVVKNSELYIKPEIVLNQVIDLIDECGYIEELHLSEANFTIQGIMIKIRSKNLDAILSLSESNNLEEEIPFEIFQKGEYSYGNFLFPWKITNEENSTDTLLSIANKIQFTDNIYVINEKDIIKVEGRASDIISFLLQMVETKQIQKYNLSISQNDLENFILLIHIN